MKYTEKIGNGFLTFDEEDINRFAPNSIKQALEMWLQASIGFIIGILIIILINELCLFICP